MRKLFIRTCAVVICLLSLGAAADAAPFVNLDFEQATVQPDDPPVVPAAAAFPGWSAQFDNVPTEFVYHDRLGAGEPVVAIFDQPIAGGSVALLQGNFMAVIEPGTPDTRTTLSQIGDIPADTRSLTLLCGGGLTPATVKVNGAVVPTLFLSGTNSFGHVVTYGADMTVFAGQTIELQFESGHYQFPQDTGARVFDDIRFSPTPIPEPSAFIVATLFLTGVALIRTRKHQKGFSYAESSRLSELGGTPRR